MRHLVPAFKLSCVIAATFMIAYWMYKFHKNEDITLIEYKLVEDLKDEENMTQQDQESTEAQ